MPYPKAVFFDFDTLLHSAQPKTILTLGGKTDAGELADILSEYKKQNQLLQKDIRVQHLSTEQYSECFKLDQRFDLVIAHDIFEHLDKTHGRQLLARMRDVLCAQYCISLPITNRQKIEAVNITPWSQQDLFAFALEQVATYPAAGENALHYGVFKYDLSAYKKTPEWLNADNWANPNMWNKYRW